jgi:Transposase IS66 family
VDRRQVVDLPQVAVKVTEHPLIERECCCGHRAKAAAPQGAEGAAQYGPRIAAIIVYLYAGQFLSRDRTAQALAELSGIALSSETAASITARAAPPLSWLSRWRRIPEREVPGPSSATASCSTPGQIPPEPFSGGNVFLGGPSQVSARVARSKMLAISFA